MSSFSKPLFQYLSNRSSPPPPPFQPSLRLLPFLSSSTSSSLIRALDQTIILNFLYFSLTEGQFQFLRLLRSMSLITRSQVHLPHERDLLQVFLGASSVTLPISLLRVFNEDWVSRNSTYSWPSLLQLLSVQLIMYLVVVFLRASTDA
jgi:hypothetical protein